MKVITRSSPKHKWNGLHRNEYIQNLKLRLLGIPNFSKAYFFGSFARAEETEWSDIDLAVILRDSKPLSNEFEPKAYWKNLELVSNYLKEFSDLDLIVYTESQWEKLTGDPNALGFWKDIQRDMKEVV